jgi:bacillithiol system protein YtxJ
VTPLNLPSDPGAARKALVAASAHRPVVVFKHSPICPISARALREFEAFLAKLPADAALGVAHIDVIAQRGLARGLTAELGIEHESPQALWFQGGALTWHDSHGQLTRARFASLLSGTPNG